MTRSKEKDRGKAKPQPRRRGDAEESALAPPQSQTRDQALAKSEPNPDDGLFVSAAELEEFGARADAWLQDPSLFRDSMQRELMVLLQFRMKLVHRAAYHPEMLKIALKAAADVEESALKIVRLLAMPESPIRVESRPAYSIPGSTESNK